jgi:hypothetical protein
MKLDDAGLRGAHATDSPTLKIRRMSDATTPPGVAGSYRYNLPVGRKG